MKIFLIEFFNFVEIKIIMFLFLWRVLPIKFLSFKYFNIRIRNYSSKSKKIINELEALLKCSENDLLLKVEKLKKEKQDLINKKNELEAKVSLEILSEIDAETIWDLNTMGVIK